MKLSICKVLVRSLDIGSFEVTWETEGGDLCEIYDFDLQVFRSESPEGPFDPISPVFTDRYIFVDNKVPKGDRFRKMWYRVRATHRASGEFKDSEAATQEAQPSLDAIYIRRNELILFSRVIGRACWLFKKRTFGARCSHCWDSITQKRMRSSCMDCFDTGFLRGYLDPIEVWVQIDPAAKAQQNQAQQVAQQVSTTGRLSFFPNVSPGDIIVEAENIRWRVVSVTQTERLRAPVHQELNLLAIDPSDIEYKLPIKLERALRDIQPSPHMMFTNPTTLEAAIEDRSRNAFDSYE